jgi:hypothetical protein
MSDLTEFKIIETIYFDLQTIRTLFYSSPSCEIEAHHHLGRLFEFVNQTYSALKEQKEIKERMQNGQENKENPNSHA